MADLSLILNAACCALVMTDGAHAIRQLNETACLLLGIERQLAIGRLWTDLVSVSNCEEPSHGSTVCYGFVNHAVGPVLPVRISTRPWITPEMEGALHTLEDLSSQHAAEREARLMAQNLHEILSKTPAVVYTKNTIGQYEYVNQRFLELFHLTLDAVIGRTDLDIFPEGEARAFRENDLIVQQTREAIQLEEMAPHDDGLHKYLSIKFPLLDERGFVRAVAGISTDVTESRRAQVLEQDAQAAALVQNQLYPHSAPVFPGYEMAGIVRPSLFASGDYYDLIPHGPGKLCVVVGDVSGHGLAAALIMVETRSILHACLEDHEDLAIVAARLNRYLCRDTAEQQFVTFFLGELDAVTRTLTYVSAGHPSWIIEDNGQIRSLAVSTIPLGLVEAIEFNTTHVPFLPGDLLFVATDGIPEVHSSEGEMYGWERTLEVIRSSREAPASAMLDQLLFRVQQFQERPQTGTSRPSAIGSPSCQVHFDDDLTAVLVKHLRPAEPPRGVAQRNAGLSGWLV